MRKTTSESDKNHELLSKMPNVFYSAKQIAALNEILWTPAVKPDLPFAVLLYGNKDFLLIRFCKISLIKSLTVHKLADI